MDVIFNKLTKGEVDVFLFGKKYKYKIFIDGMSCGHCSSRVEAGLNENKDFSAKVELDEKCAYLTSKRIVTENEVKKVVEKTGFTFVKFDDLNR